MTPTVHIAIVLGCYEVSLHPFSTLESAIEFLVKEMCQHLKDQGHEDPGFQTWQEYTRHIDELATGTSFDIHSLGIDDDC